MTETELIKACKWKKRNAEKLLYERYATPLYRLCFRYISSKVEAEDVLLKTFFKVFKHLNKFSYKGEGSLEAWMRKIAVNECLMYLRKNHPIKVELESYTWEMGIAPQSEGDMFAEDIYKLVKSLPLGYRTVFNLYVIEGYSHQEIAKKLGVSESTSKSQLSRARAMLKERLKALNMVNYEI